MCEAGKHHYLFKIASMSPSTACREWVVPLAIVPCSDADVPLATIACEVVSFRFATEGDMGAGGSEGGARASSAAAMATMGAVGDARE